MWYWIFRAIFIVILKLFFRFKVEGVENIPQNTNFIVAANHASYLDTLAIGAAIPKKVYWIALRDLYRVFWLRWFLRLIDTLPSGSVSEKAVSLLRENKNVGIFPEGGRTQDGRLREFKRGASVLALKTGRPLVPCAILGTYEALPKTAKFPRPYPITVKIGEPVYLLKEFEESIDDIHSQEGMFKIKKVIKGLLNAC